MNDPTDHRTPVRELLYEQPLQSGATVCVYSEAYDVDQPPSLRIEKVQPGRGRLPLNFAMPAKFADGFVAAILQWQERIALVGRRVAQQPALNQRGNRPRPKVYEVTPRRPSRTSEGGR